MRTSIYRPADTYYAALDKFEAIIHVFDPAAIDPVAFDMLRSDMIQVLGEELGVWPITAFTGEDEGEVIVVE